MAEHLSLRRRIQERERVIGTFLKTSSYQTVEILGTTGIDFIVIDSEHACFSRHDIDTCMLAARASNLPALVRVSSSAETPIREALDVGATGIMAPHAKSAQVTKDIVAATRYRNGIRGFSNSPRAGGYGTIGMAQHIAQSDENTIVICQIEDRDAIEDIDAVASVLEVDCLFIGRADLALSYGASSVTDSNVENAIVRICAACEKAKKPIGIFLADTAQVDHYMKLGITLFVIGSDQSLLRNSTINMGRAFKQMNSKT
ncbi:MAG: aldolase [Burkholderiaceae bacterium]|nr:MAG: aldolase [Burkholderiaceae bacterium]TAM11698.1 MAG: aldolase [Pusillimonas sp.]